MIRRSTINGATAILAALWFAGLSPCCWAQGWTDTRVAGPFVCRADFSLDGMEALFEDLGQLQHDLVRLLGIRPAGETIELYLLGDEWTYRQFVSRHVPGVPYRRALYVKSGGVGRVFAYRSRELETDVRHECTHALLHASLPMVPLWLDEGLAEYFELPTTQRAFDSPYLKSVRWGAWLSRIASLGTLEDKGDLSEMGGSEYRNAWAWTHFMLHGPREAHDELVRYLGDIRSRSPPGLLSDRLRHRLPDLQRRVGAHFRGWRR